MKPVKPPQNRLPSIDDLDQAIVNLAARINAETYELLVLVRQFDERAGWLKWGLGNCAEWLHWRCDLSMNAAREKVRVAHALKTLPNIAAAFATGELSYSKVRAMTRVAGGQNEGDLLSMMTITIELPTETGELVEKALDKARDDSASKVEFVDDLDPARRDLGPARRESWSARQADASRHCLTGMVVQVFLSRVSKDCAVTVTWWLSAKMRKGSR